MQATKPLAAWAALGALMMAAPQVQAQTADADLRREFLEQKARLEALEKRLLAAEKASADKAAADKAAAEKSSVAKPVAAKPTDSLGLYGIADAGVEVGRYGKGTKVRMQSGLGSASRLGFKGERSFGDDLSAYFQLEMGVSFDNGQNTGHSSNVSNPGAGTLSAAAPNTTGVAVFSRNTFVGLNSKSLGDVRVGRDYTPMYSITSSTDPFTIGGGTAFRLWSSAAASRFDNGLFYSTPGLGGVRVNLAYSAGMENNSTSNVGVTGGTPGASSSTGPKDEGRGTSASLTYTSGGLFLAAGYLDYAKMGTVAAPAIENSHRRSYNLAGTYMLGDVKLYGQYLKGRDRQQGLANPVTLDRTVWWLGAAVPLSAADTLRLVYSSLDDRLATDRDSRHVGLGYEHALDKRTDLYVYYAQVSNSNGGQNSLCAGGTCQGYDKDSGLPANATPRSLMMGARYRF